MTSETYKLSKYPIGSMREIWHVSYPLMLSFLSGSLMIFFDRLILSRYTIQALNAAANAGLAVWMFLVIPMLVTSISEVFVGQYHGGDNKNLMGQPVWQMIWFSLLMTPILSLIGIFTPDYLFSGTGNEELESVYFTLLMFFGSAICAVSALNGYFVGRGKVFVVTIGAVISNLINICLDWVLVFGWGPIPSFGIKGAAIATGLAQVMQCVFLFTLFLSPENRKKRGTGNWKFHKKNFWDCIRIGLPAGVGHCSEMVAHFVFFRMIIMSGGDGITIAAIVQSIYILVFFSIEGLSKAVTAITSNLIGGKQWQLIGNVLRSAVSLQLCFFLALISLFIFTPELLLSVFFSEEEYHLTQDPNFMSLLKHTTLWVCVFFLFDGICWIFAGLLTAAGDTKFILFVTSVFNWILYIFPVYLIINYLGANVAQAWIVTAFYSFAIAFTYWLRYRSGVWRNIKISSEQV